MAALDIIRTETVLSRMPVHNLAKQGNVNIQILKTTADGKVELKWIVSYSDRYGQARQLAYKLDTIVINHHIDEQGRRADAVYIILNEPYREVLNNAPVRPLDRAYMKALPPGAQRFYEIISYKIFSAIKNDYPHAKIAYSEYRTFSAQLRHYERQPVHDQMAKVIHPHKQSGYITAIRYEPTIGRREQAGLDSLSHPRPQSARGVRRRDSACTSSPVTPGSSSASNSSCRSLSVSLSGPRNPMRCLRSRS